MRNLSITISNIPHLMLLPRLNRSTKDIDGIKFPILHGTGYFIFITSKLLIIFIIEKFIIGFYPLKQPVDFCLWWFPRPGTFGMDPVYGHRGSKESYPAHFPTGHIENPVSKINIKNPFRQSPDNFRPVHTTREIANDIFFDQVFDRNGIFF